MTVNWGHHIREIRERKKLTQAEIAKRTGFSRSHISHIESGRYPSVKPVVLEKLANALELTVGELAAVIWVKRNN